MTNSKPNSFVLSKARTKNSPNSPDYYARVELDADTVASLVLALDNGEPAELRIACWVKKNEGGQFLTGAVSIPQNASQGSRSGSDRGDRQASRGNRPARAATQPRPYNDGDDFDDEIPF